MHRDLFLAADDGGKRGHPRNLFEKDGIDWILEHLF